MRAVQITAFGGPEILAPVELPDPRPGPGELLVDVAVAGVNYIDTYNRSGAYPVDLPFVLGQEGAGRVAALGPDNDTGGFAVGDRVAWANIFGGYAEREAVPADAGAVVVARSVATTGSAHPVSGSNVIVEVSPASPTALNTNTGPRRPRSGPVCLAQAMARLR